MFWHSVKIIRPNFFQANAINYINYKLNEQISVVNLFLI